MIAGLGGMISLPISAYPDIIPPSVTVSATYPGATAETIAATVAAPLEKEINGVEGMLYMTSVNSGNGTLMITVTFNIGTDPDMATVNVNNRIQAAVPRLPDGSETAGRSSCARRRPRSCRSWRSTRPTTAWTCSP